MKGARGCLIVLGVVITLGIYITILRLTWPVCLPTVLAAAGWFFTGVSKGTGGTNPVAVVFDGTSADLR